MGWPVKIFVLIKISRLYCNSTFNRGYDKLWCISTTLENMDILGLSWLWCSASVRETSTHSSGHKSVFEYCSLCPLWFAHTVDQLQIRIMPFAQTSNFALFIWNVDKSGPQCCQVGSNLMLDFRGRTGIRFGCSSWIWIYLGVISWLKNDRENFFQFLKVSLMIGNIKVWLKLKQE